MQQPIEHQSNCSQVDHQFRRLHAIFVILAETTITPEPSEAAFNDPCQTGNLEGTSLSFDDL
jgi:hypothetical protein